MSVTFYAEQSPVVGSRVVCGHDEEYGRFDSYDEAVEWLLEWRSLPEDARATVCDDEYCVADFGPMIVSVLAGPDSDELNVSSFNARDLLDVLGLGGEEEAAGMEDAEVFLGRVLMALAVAPVSPERLAYTDHRGGALMIYGGREEDYIAKRLVVLHEIAVWALDHGRRVCWD